MLYNDVFHCYCPQMHVYTCSTSCSTRCSTSWLLLSHRDDFPDLFPDDDIQSIRTQVTSHHCSMLLPKAGASSCSVAVQPYTEDKGRVSKVCKKTNEETSRNFEGSAKNQHQEQDDESVRADKTQKLYKNIKNIVRDDS